MKYYLAARYSRHPEMREYRSQLEALGFGVTSRWIDAHNGKWQQSMTLEQIRNMTTEAASYAEADLEDIDEASGIIAFTEANNGSSKGGRHVEFGYALCRGKLLIVIGPFENIFYAQADQRYETWEEFVEAISAKR